MVEQRSAARRGAGRSRAGAHLALAGAGLAVLLACAVVAADGHVPGAERDVLHAVNDLPGWLYPLLWPFQQFGNLVLAVVVGAALALVLRRRDVAAAVVLAGALKLALERVVKAAVERERPGTSVGDVQLRGDVSADGLSFVSGHATITTAVAGLVAPLLPGRWKVVPWLIAGVNGLTRVYVGAHNPLDVVGGIGLGLVIAGVLNAGLLVLRGRGRTA